MAEEREYTLNIEATIHAGGGWVPLGEAKVQVRATGDVLSQVDLSVLCRDLARLALERGLYAERHPKEAEDAAEGG